jgi:hypothetical protein
MEALEGNRTGPPLDPGKFVGVKAVPVEKD